jgi:7,8-dihydro-6-hydroxymethylpterin dimethyltransferase
MDRKYIFHESTISICPKCLERVPTKIIFENNQVFLKKYCKNHGEQRELFEEDIEYYKNKREYDKPSTISKTQTNIKNGCPFDCGLCPSHDQHTCIALIEVTNRCNLKCPTCYANSDTGGFLSIEKLSKMMDFLIESEGGEAEILQISGGEPTLHPDIIKIIRLARTKKIRYVMLNTNGIRIAQDEEFVKELSKFKGGFEVYLQFDGFSRKTNIGLRGKDISKIKLKAIENLKKYNVPITLVATIQKGLNDHELGKIIQFGMETPCIRGVNFQPIAFFGRGNFKDTKNRITLSGIIKKIEKRLPKLFIKGDIIPLPCNVERVAVTYMARSENNVFIPITRNIKIKSYLPLIDNTFAFEADRILKNKSKELLTNPQGCNCLDFIKDIRVIIPLSYSLKSNEEKLKYLNENTFRISITSFVDVYNFDIKSMQKECVHIITPDLKKIPFSAYNMFHRK